LPELSRRPYLLRAMHELMIDCGHTPHAIVDATQPGVQVPTAFVKEGRIVLNVSPGATQALLIGPDVMEFNARFGGVSHYVRVPLNAVLGIYARETGEGMVFADEAGETAGEPDPDSPTPTPPPPKAPDKPKRPSLKVVK
jgi:stringent starvation protein B